MFNNNVDDDGDDQISNLHCTFSNYKYLTSLG